MMLRTRCFTLLETLVATTILGGLLVGALLGVREAVLREGDGVLEARATSIAQRELDIAMALQDVVAPMQQVEGRFAWVLRVDLASPTLLRGSVVVTWRTNGRTEQLERTVLARRDAPTTEAAP